MKSVLDNCQLNLSGVLSSPGTCRHWHSAGSSSNWKNIVGCTRLALYMEFARLLFCVPDDGRVRNRDGSKKGAANFCDETLTVKE